MEGRGGPRIDNKEGNSTIAPDSRAILISDTLGNVRGSEGANRTDVRAEMRPVRVQGVLVVGDKVARIPMQVRKWNSQNDSMPSAQRSMV